MRCLGAGGAPRPVLHGRLQAFLDERSRRARLTCARIAALWQALAALNTGSLVGFHSMVKSDGFVMGRRVALRVLGGMAAGLGVGASVQAQTAGGAGGLGGSALQAVGRLFSRPQGNLLIVGGGDTPLSVQQRFVALAGGPENARIAVLPMASSQSDEEAQEVVRDLEGLGARAQVVEIRPTDVNSAAVAQTLEKFSGFWFSGGDQSRLSSLLVGTRALQAIEARYQAGAVVGGTSAGASVMSRLMLTGKWRTPRNSDEEEQVNIARGMKELAPGFGFFKGAIVDQHFMHRARYNRLISAVLDHPQLIGVGIDEETALLVRADGQWEVLGNYYVKIFDARRAQIVDDRGPMAKAADIRMHVLPEGGLFDPRRRRVEFQEVNIP